MLVELTGCSSAGKSTLLTSMLLGEAEATTRELAIAERLRTGWIRSRAVNTLIEDAVAVWALLRKPSDLIELRRAVRAAGRNIPRSSSRREKANRVRNAYRHIGMLLFVSRFDHSGRIIIFDTGPVHTAHNFFVHLSAPPDGNAVSSYLDHIPLPDFILVIAEEPNTLVDRTLTRGHRRVAAGSRAEATRFVAHSSTLFDSLREHPRLRSRMATLGPGDARDGLKNIDTRITELLPSSAVS